MTTTPARTASGPPAQVSPRQALVAIVRQNRTTIDRLLAPTGVPTETFIAQLDMAVRQTPGLLQADMESLLGGMLHSARYGLAPNTEQNLCWLLPRKVQGRHVAVWTIGYGGILELARRAGVRFHGGTVFPGDDFYVDAGDFSTFRHVPAFARTPSRKRGAEGIAWYVVATFPDGERVVGWLDRAQVEQDHRAHSDAPNSPMWTKWFDAGAQKSVVKEMRKYLPITPVLTEAINSDGAVFDLGEMAEDQAQIDPPKSPELEVDELDPGRPFDEE